MGRGHPPVLPEGRLGGRAGPARGRRPGRDRRTVSRSSNRSPRGPTPGAWTGRSGYAPLHQAAWHGAAAGTIERLLEYGAFGTLRASDATRPPDIAVSRGHHHLDALLRPEIRHPLPQDVIAGLRQHFHRLIRCRSGGGNDGDGGSERRTG
ncbi:hypothetical protein ACFZAV_22785 [Streptomyces sp. NPDC008343]|uniref:hypothetical protein n=1 Tax=Streptomyces sp. NPDC008343 TaxID=3364828 RepID=UPI0036EB8692